MGSQTISMFISALALMLSFSSAVFSFRADGRARESVRPYLSTEVHLLSHDMSVLLSNYGAGVAIMTKISISRGEMQPKRSLGSLLPLSPNYEIDVVDFVQDQYYFRPGDKLSMVTVGAKGNENAAEAMRDYLINALDGIKIEIDYLDVLGEKFHYSRVISLKAPT